MHTQELEGESPPHFPGSECNLETSRTGPCGLTMSTSPTCCGIDGPDWLKLLELRTDLTGERLNVTRLDRLADGGPRMKHDLMVDCDGTHADLIEAAMALSEEGQDVADLAWEGEEYEYV